jgi:prepilin-type processing-associated H-X9-DG protein
LIEVMVVLAIIVVLAALMLPAIHKVREAAARSNCTNNMRQLGVATLQYANANRAFPPAGVTCKTAGLGGNRSVFTFMLAEFEQDNLAQLYDTALNWDQQPSVYHAEIRTLICPSAPTSHRDSYSQRGSNVTNAATSDYNVVTDVRASAFVTIPLRNNQGLLRLNELTRPSECTDGLSNTILLVEDAGRPDPHVCGQRQSGRAAGGIWADPAGTFSLTGHSVDGLKQPGPCAVNCSNNGAIFAFHNGGANIVLGDGSARFLRSDIDINVVAALVTRANGETLSNDF